MTHFNYCANDIYFFAASWNISDERVLRDHEHHSDNGDSFRISYAQYDALVDETAKAMMSLGVKLTALQADGGITGNSFIMQFIANVLNAKVDCLDVREASALGASFMAGIGAGLYKNIEELEEITFNSTVYSPVSGNNASAYYQEWKTVIREFQV